MEPLDYVMANRQAILDDLIAFASIPSVSTDPAYAAHIQEGAAFVAERMRRAGLENIKINPTEGHPVVTSDWSIPSSCKIGSWRVSIISICSRPVSISRLDSS